MSAPGVVDGVTPARGRVFRYEGFATDAAQGLLTCRYSLDGREFSERVTLAPGPRWDTPAAQAAARLVFLLAGVSYYKTAAPPVIHLGTTPLTDHERAFLRDFYLQGLGEYAYKNALDLSDLDIQAASATVTHPALSVTPSTGSIGVAGVADTLSRALVPFGGGIDSIVTVEGVRKVAADVALFVVSRPGDRFRAIEGPAAVSGLPDRRRSCGLRPSTSARRRARRDWCAITSAERALRTRELSSLTLRARSRATGASCSSPRSPTLRTTTNSWAKTSM